MDTEREDPPCTRLEAMDWIMLALLVATGAVMVLPWLAPWLLPWITA